MRAFHIISQKEFMSALLAGTSFDSFIVCEAQVTTFTTFTIDGSWHPDFLDTENGSGRTTDAQEPPRTSSSLTWRLVRPFLFSLIRGKKPPRSVKAVLRLSDEGTGRVLQAAGGRISPQDVAGLYLTVRYDGSGITLLTGSSLRVFTMDRTLEQTWDSMTDRFLTRLRIAHEEA